MFLSLKISEKRQEYLELLDHVLEYCYKKFRAKYTKASVRLSYGRLIVQALSTGGSLLKDEILDDLERRVCELEKK